MPSVPSVGAFMQGFLNGYKAFPDADDRAYKKLKNELVKSQIAKNNRPAGGGKPARDFSAQNELARARAKTEGEKQEYYRWKRDQKNTQPSETDNVLGGISAPAAEPQQAIPTTPQPPGGWPAPTPGPQSAIEAPVQTAENEPDDDEDEPEQVAEAGDVGDDDEVSASRGGAIYAKIYESKDGEPDGNVDIPLKRDRTGEDSVRLSRPRSGIPARNYAGGGDVEEGDDEDDEDDKPDTGDDAEEGDEGGDATPSYASPQNYSALAAHDAVRDGITSSLPPPGAVPGPAQSAAHTQHLRGANAASQVDMDRIRKKVDPEGKMDESDRNMAAFSAVQQYYLKKNDPEAARAMSSSMVGYFRQQYDKNRMLASVAAEHGDIDKAIAYAQKSYVNVPDGMKLNVAMNEDGNYIYAVVDAKTGEPAMNPETVTPEVMLQKIQQGAQQTFNGLIASAAGMRQEKEAKPAKGPAEPRASEFHSAAGAIDEKLGDIENFNKLPKDTQATFKNIATDLAARNRMRPDEAITITNSLKDGDVESKPIPGGGRTYRLPDGREYTMGRNAALQLDMERSKAAEVKKAEAGKAKEKATARSRADEESRAARGALEATRKPSVAISPYSRQPQTAIPLPGQ